MNEHDAPGIDSADHCVRELRAHDIQNERQHAEHLKQQKYACHRRQHVACTVKKVQSLAHIDAGLACAEVIEKIVGDARFSQWKGSVKDERYERVRARTEKVANE